jgi:glutamate synthase domain-containing protein 3
MEDRIKIDAQGLHYKVLNQQIHDALGTGGTDIELSHVNGQRYIADGLKNDIQIEINGVPGNDLGIFMNGPVITVNNNAQDAVGNTMNGGKIIIKGMAGDVCGYGMRGGKLFILKDAGYRVGIHMKGYKDLNPIIVIGGNAGDFLAEYMAGGVIVLLRMFGRQSENNTTGDYLGAGMHGGTVYIRGGADRKKIGKGVDVAELTQADRTLLEGIIKEYAADLDLDADKILSERFDKLIPLSTRPYAKLYTY